MDFLWDVHEASVGRILLISSQRGLVRLGLPTQSSETVLENFIVRTHAILTHRENSVISKAKRQLDDYFLGLRQGFTVALDVCGTDFQKKVWQHLQKIPYGQTQSYMKVAQSIDYPKACRAVGSANHHNPVPILIPCHRVISKDGTLGGFANNSAQCLNLKRMMLQLEKKACHAPLPHTSSFLKQPDLNNSH